MARRPVPPAERPSAGQNFWLTLLVVVAAVPLLRHLDWQIGAFVVALFAFRLLALRWPAMLASSWVLLALTLIGVANCLNTYHSLAGQYGGSALFLTMVALKLLELRARRDLFLTLILLGFLVVVQFLFDQSLPLALYLFGVILASLVLMADLNGTLGSSRLRAALGVAGRLSLQAAPLTLVLFLFFPRLTAPLWDLGLDQTRGQTGMSDTMEPGAVSELVVNGDLAFRARFEGQSPPPAQSYWRGLVLWETDGRRWLPGEPPLDRSRTSELAQSGNPLDYEVLLEPTRKNWLFALDMPVTAPEQGQFAADGRLLARRPVATDFRYRVRSALTYRTPDASPAVRAYALRLPDNVTARERALVARWRADGSGDWQVVQKALAFFNKEAFHYTLLPPPLGANPTDEFLFETRSGFCEHYAGSFALLMRIAGIPSRVVLGYLGGEQNGIGGYTMVWQSDAHAWVEVMIAGRGWVRVDPTAAVDPSRVDNRSAAQMLGGGGTSVRFQLQQSGALVRFVRDLRMFADSIDAAWQNWVLDFSLEDQLRLLDRIGLGGLREYGLGLLMIVAVSLTLGAIMLGLLRTPRESDPLVRVYREFCRRLARIGLRRREHEGPLDHGARVARARPDLAPVVEQFLALYVPARFGTADPDENLGRLRALLRGFHPRRARPRLRSAGRGRP